ncbi:uncharacterized protein TNCV_1032411 [Trichonephila clavipes]|nr:uncharacterized protein TNCV_1032411 [Trichonephila clavipes]
MWFKILLSHQYYPLAAMVGKDGKLYFRRVDVGALLGRSKATCLWSYETSPVLHAQDSPVPNSILVRKWAAQDFIQKGQDMRRMQHGSTPLLRMVYEVCLRAGANIWPSAELAERLSLPERIPTPPAERQPLEMVDPSVFANKVEVTPRIPTPSLITRCDKGTQTISPYLHVKRPEYRKEAHGTTTGQ